MAEWRRWREKRPDGTWSSWYTGFFLPMDGYNFLLAKLYDRWRVILVDPAKFDFESVPGMEIELPPGIELHSVSFYSADDRFQHESGLPLDEIERKLQLEK